MTERPKFISSARIAAPASPEELFLLLERSRTHGYLRGPQQDVLRQYIREAVEASDVALELPTGTGKTAIGLLIAEWKRSRFGSPAAYLTLTNQLAHQVMDEARRLGLVFADLTGGRGARDAAEEGRYRTGQAIGVTTYSNLFNVNPVVQPSGLLVFDDVHGGEHYVADMWTVRVSSREDEDLYHSLLDVLGRALTDSQRWALNDPHAHSAVHLADLELASNSFAAIVALLDGSEANNVRFAWSLIRNKLHACVVLLSRSTLCIRPIVPPTHTHPPFADSQQRVYMSATLGNEGDLKRAFGVRSMKVLTAPHAQWGHRYIFVPELYCSEEEAWRIVANVWDKMAPRRAVMLAPSARILDEAFDDLNANISGVLKRISALDIVDSLDTFTNEEDAVLAVAARYDGLDLPDEDCRLLLMVESPGAIGELERHMREQWKLGPVLQRKERVRLIQGLGRCTRNATDFAAVIWIGQTLVDASTNRTLVSGYPPELRGELAWGLQQSQVAGSGADELVAMVTGLLEDVQYRAEANQQIAALVPTEVADETPLDWTGELDVLFCRQLWDEDYEGAYETARRIADQLGEPSLSGLRAWWWYLARSMAHRLGNKVGEVDCLQRAHACGVNSGWLRSVARMRGNVAPQADQEEAANMEQMWENLQRLGFAGPRFDREMGRMSALLSEGGHTKFHEGLEILGMALGALVTRTSAAGAPDVVWVLAEDVVAFEAKTEKAPGSEFSKTEIQQANGHTNWAKDRLNADPSRTAAIVVSEATKVHETGLPHIQKLCWISPEEVRQLGREVQLLLATARATYAGQEFAAIQSQFAADIRQAGLGSTAIMRRLSSTLLADRQ